MAGITHLVPTTDLKIDFLAQIAKSNQMHLFVNHDRDFDALTFSYVSPNIETIVHYLDDDVALLYRADDLQIVGVQVENFEYKFLPLHPAVQRAWDLDDKHISLHNMGDIIAAINDTEASLTNLAKEVVKATEDTLGEPGVELLALLA